MSSRVLAGVVVAVALPLANGESRASQARGGVGTLVADAGADYIPGVNFGDVVTPPDSLGTGMWQYLISNTENPAVDPSLRPMAWDTVLEGFESEDFLHVDGFNGTELSAGSATELAIYPNSPGDEWVVARWTAGAGVPPQLRLEGTARKGEVGGNGVTFLVYVGGIRRISLDLDFDDETGLPYALNLEDVEPGDVVDFVVSNAGDATFDRTLFSAKITQIPAPASAVALAIVSCAIARRRRD